jgi:hypothetical protein
MRTYCKDCVKWENINNSIAAAKKAAEDYAFVNGSEILVILHELPTNTYIFVEIADERIDDTEHYKIIDTLIF